jgi:hypothetical protein
MLRIRAVVCALAVSFAAPAAATTYLTVTFEELVARADVIFVGDVVDVRSFTLDTREGPVIKTRVIFRVSDALLASTSVLEILEFLGGEVDGIGMAVAEMPAFAVGDRRVVFARRERSINPIVGFTQGLLRISRDASGVDRVTTLAGEPVAGPQSFGLRPPEARTPATVPMRLSELRDRINRALIEGRRK